MLLVMGFATAPILALCWDHNAEPWVPPEARQFIHTVELHGPLKICEGSAMDRSLVLAMTLTR